MSKVLADSAALSEVLRRHAENWPILIVNEVTQQKSW